MEMHQDEAIREGIAANKHRRGVLLDAEERMNLLEANVRDYAILTMDPDGLVASWNAGAESVFGWTESEIMGRDAAILFTPEDRQSGVPEAERREALQHG